MRTSRTAHSPLRERLANQTTSRFKRRLRMKKETMMMMMMMTKMMN